MYPVSTEYRLANEQDLQQLYDTFDIPCKLGWPTVVAVRGNKLLGFLSTQERDEAVVAGPLMVNCRKGKSKAFVCLRLVEAYDNLMRAMGIRKYLFHVAKDETPAWVRQVDEAGIYAIINETDAHLWYERDLSFQKDKGGI
jgi:hypothetical protein